MYTWITLDSVYTPAEKMVHGSSYGTFTQSSIRSDQWWHFHTLLGFMFVTTYLKHMTDKYNVCVFLLTTQTGVPQGSYLGPNACKLLIPVSVHKLCIASWVANISEWISRQDSLKVKIDWDFVLSRCCPSPLAKLWWCQVVKPVTFSSCLQTSQQYSCINQLCVEGRMADSQVGKTKNFSDYMSTPY